MIRSKLPALSPFLSSYMKTRNCLVTVCEKPAYIRYSFKTLICVAEFMPVLAHPHRR